MKRKLQQKLKILVVDIGGSHVKCAASDDGNAVQFVSGPKMTPRRMMKDLLKVIESWRFDVISIGYPGVVNNGKIAGEPPHLASGWVGFDFDSAFGRPVKIINDAAMQAFGGYTGGKMLFLGLGTSLGSALIVDGIVVAMELGHLRSGNDCAYEDLVGENARERVGNKKWRKNVWSVVKDFRNALLPDYIVMGGGNVRHLKSLPPQTRMGSNLDAITGGRRLWDKPER